MAASAARVRERIGALHLCGLAGAMVFFLPAGNVAFGAGSRGIHRIEVPMTWDAPASCPDSAEMHRRLRKRGVRADGLRGEIVFRIAAPQSPERPWSMHIHVQGDAPRTLHAGSCEDLAQAALTIAQLSWAPQVNDSTSKGRGRTQKNPRRSESNSRPQLDVSSETPSDISDSVASRSPDDEAAVTAVSNDTDETMIADRATVDVPESEVVRRSEPQTAKHQSKRRSESQRQGELFIDHVELGLSAAVEMGTYPRFQPAALLMVAARHKHWALQMRGGISMGKVMVRSGERRYGAQLVGLTSRASICYRLSEIRSVLTDLCAGAGPAWMWGSAQGDVEDARSQWLAYGEYGAALSLMPARAWRGFRPGFLVSVSHAPKPPDFQIEGASSSLCCGNQVRAEVGVVVYFDKHLSRKGGAR